VTSAQTETKATATARAGIPAAVKKINTAAAETPASYIKCHFKIIIICKFNRKMSDNWLSSVSVSKLYLSCA
jgi:hypothetical protein